MTKYQNLKQYLTRVTDLQYLSTLLFWETRISGTKSSKEYLIEVKTRIDGEIFELTTSDEYGSLLKDLIESSEMNEISEAEQRYITNLYIKYTNFKKIPSDFYKEYIRHSQISTNVWEQAKEENNYELFKPYLKKNIELTKQYYSYIDSSKNLYDVMLSEYERNMTSDVIDKLFNELKKFLIPLIQDVKTEKKIFKKEYTDKELLETAKYLLNYIGFDNEKGIIGIYPHGFTEKLNANDIRIAFEKSTNPFSFIGTVVHEGGHGIFEQSISENLSIFSNKTIENLYALHESQSRFYENILARNKNFWIPIYDDIKRLLKIDMELDEFMEYLNNINPGTIRTRADELTYALHIIIRYEIERDLFNDKISTDNLPEIWNEKMRQYLGIIPENDSEGLMQDIHWSESDFGYFPSYLIGNIYDGMFITAIENNVGSIDELLKNGEIKKITAFLKENIYKFGGAYNSSEIINKICNQELSTEPIISYYKRKYIRKNDLK